MDEKNRAMKSPQEERWPRLTQTLTGPDRPESCRCCGEPADDLWQEHDDQDRPEHRYLWLCRRCGDRTIEPHPRLYNRLDNCHPAPGAMRICGDCKHRATGGQCLCPSAKAHGGDGISITAHHGARGFIDGTDRKGRRWGRAFISYNAPPSKCSGKEPSAENIGGSA